MSKSIKAIESSLEDDENWSCPFVFYCGKSNKQIDLSQHLINKSVRKSKKTKSLNFTFNLDTYCGAKDEESLCKSMSISAAKQGFQFSIEKRKSRYNLYSRELIFSCTRRKIYKSEAIIRANQKTTCAINKEQSCTCVAIYIKCKKSDGSYEIIPQKSNDQPLTDPSHVLVHTNHAKIPEQFLMRSKKFLTKEQLQTIKEDRNAGMTVGQQTVKLNQITDNVFFDTDVLKNVNHDIKKEKRKALGFTKGMSSAEELMKVIENCEGYNFICLFDVDGKLVMEKGKGRPKKIEHAIDDPIISLSDVIMDESTTIELTEDQLEEMREYHENESAKAKATNKTAREQLKVNDGESVKILLACAWCSDEDLKTWHLFPEVLTVDTTMKTNNEKRSLFSGTIIDHNGKIQQVLKMFLPSEQTWVFHFIFSKVIPAMIGNETVKRIRIVISDGDSCEYSPLRNLCSNVTSSPWYGCFAGLYTFHRINLSWQKYVVKHANNKKSKRLLAVILKWINSLIFSIETV